MPNVISPERAARGAGAGLSWWLASKLLSGPVAMEAGQVAHLAHALSERVFDSALQIGGLGASRFVGKPAAGAGYDVTEDGVAIVRVAGLLLDRGSWLGDLYGMATTYEGLSEQLRRIAKDDGIKEILLDIDSNGGMVAGLLDLCADLSKAGGKRKVYAIAQNVAASAAYAIACCADEVFVTRHGGAGSIGTVTSHTSFARALEEAGVDTTLITEGAHKGDRHPAFPLSHGARAEMMAEAAQANANFVALVAKERGVSEEHVRDLQARMFWGDKAVAAKLADGVKSFDEALEHIRARRSAGGRPRGSAPKSKSSASPSPSPSTPKGDPGMPGNETSGGTPDYAALAVTIAGALNASKPAAPVAPAAAPAAPAQAAAPANDAERIFGILECDEAKERPKLAAALAKDPGMTLDRAKALLGAAAVEKPAAPAAETVADALAVQMASKANRPGVKPDASPEQKTPAKQSFSQLCAATAKKGA